MTNIQAKGQGQRFLVQKLDRFWSNQDVLYDYRADLHGITLL